VRVSVCKNARVHRCVRECVKVRENVRESLPESASESVRVCVRVHECVVREFASELMHESVCTTSLCDMGSACESFMCVRVLGSVRKSAQERVWE
jgi:hypothetical protein